MVQHKYVNCIGQSRLGLSCPRSEICVKLGLIFAAI